MKSLFSFIVLMVLLWGGPAFSEDLVMVTGEWRPYTSERMKDKGYFTRIVTEVVREMGARPHLTFPSMETM